MPTETEKLWYTASQYRTLTTAEKAILVYVNDYLHGNKLEAQTDEEWTEAFNLMRPCSGCVPPEEIGDSVEKTIRNKFGAVYWTAAELAELELAKKDHKPRVDFSFCLVVDASFEDATHVAILDFKRPACYLHDWAKAWAFNFETLGDLVEAVITARNEIVKNYENQVGQGSG